MIVPAMVEPNQGYNVDYLRSIRECFRVAVLCERCSKENEVAGSAGAVRTTSGGEQHQYIIYCFPQQTVVQNPA